MVPYTTSKATPPHLAPSSLSWQATELITIAEISATDVTRGTFLKC